MDDPKTLIHALLCDPDGPCSRPDCTLEVAAIKEALKQMEAHATECTVSANVPGRRRKQQECGTCAKWRQLQKLRDRFTRQLLQASSRQKRRDDSRKKKRAECLSDAKPKLLKRQVTMVLESAASDDTLDLSLLPQLVEGELKVQRRRKRAKESAAEADDVKAAAAEAPMRKRKGGGEAAEGGETAAPRSKKAKQRPADEARLQQLITEGARLAQAPNGHGMAAWRKLQRASSAASADELEAAPAEEDYPPSERMHIAFDRARKAATPPDTFDPILTAAPPKKSNLAEVTAVNADGSCDAAVVCNEQLPAGRTCAGKCGAGAVVRALRAAQRQIVSWLKVPATLLDDAAPCTRLPKYPRAFNHQDCVQRLQAGQPAARAAEAALRRLRPAAGRRRALPPRAARRRQPRRRAALRAVLRQALLGRRLRARRAARRARGRGCTTRRRGLRRPHVAARGGACRLLLTSHPPPGPCPLGAFTRHRPLASP